MIGTAATIDYTNHRGERRTRRIRPHAVVWKESPYHPGGPRWFLQAFDLEEEYPHIKDFSLRDVHAWIDPEAGQ